MSGQDWSLILDDDETDPPFLKAQIAEMRKIEGSSTKVLAARDSSFVPEINVNSEPISESELYRRRKSSL